MMTEFGIGVVTGVVIGMVAAVAIYGLFLMWSRP